METVLLIAVIMVTAFMILLAAAGGVVVGLLENRAGADAPKSVLRGMKAFATALGAMLGVATFIAAWIWYLYLRNR
ncbi:MULTISPECIES: hypothetical protein [Streptomyces]|uniref:hypothetical protein n=1 Tax=Streptomyces TaxID=1883 RepID=UPI0013C46BB4|nr:MULTISPECIES: hypothetical protein [Streptomyces]MDX3066396.1 hypothetical protein [Streptomyces sp. ND04-05B]MDX3519456.1 hypothetical protein [Streptomyces scabiei]